MNSYMKRITFEEACEVPNWTKTDVANNKLFKEAFENNLCEVMADTSSCPINLVIIYKKPDLADDVLGYGIHIFRKDISVYIMHTDYNSGLHVVDIDDINADLSTIVSQANMAVNICPVCKENVPFKDQRRYSFAGRCCMNCLPKMKAIYEKPGWTK